MIALVTGANGFIGGSLAASLSASGWEVRVVVRASSRTRLRGSERYRVFEADLTASSGVLEEAVAGCDVVFHAAAIRDRWGTSPEEYRRVNVEGTRRLLAAAAGRALRFVYISSVGVLGWPGVDGIDESFPVDVRPGEIDYHGTKAAAEQLVHAWPGGMDTVVVRPTITYGPGDGDGMLTRLIRLIARGHFIRIGRGENRLHLTYIDDLVQGLILAGTHPSAPGETFILAGHGPILVRELHCANRPGPRVRTAFPLPARAPGAADRPGGGGPPPGGRRAWAATASIQPTRDVRQAQCSVRAPQLLLGQGGPAAWLHPAR